MVRRSHRVTAKQATMTAERMMRTTRQMRTTKNQTIENIIIGAEVAIGASSGRVTSASPKPQQLVATAISQQPKRPLETTGK